MKEYYCEVSICFAGNNFEANNKKEYIDKVKESFKEEFNIDLVDSEISKIEELALEKSSCKDDYIYKLDNPEKKEKK